MQQPSIRSGTIISPKWPTSTRSAIELSFQGATAKNYALVKAFEQKLQKPITVSKFCHLTGAFGVCLKMADADLARESRFRKDLHAEQVVVDEYVCEYCKNHCKIKSIDLDGETLGWGYLCGRDEHDPGYRRKDGFRV